MSMSYKENVSANVVANFDVNAFWTSMDLYINRQYIVNKRLWGCKVLGKFEKCIKNLKGLTFNKLKLSKIDFTEKDFDSIFSVSETVEGIMVEFLFFELLPKNYKEKRAIQLVCINAKENQVVFHNITNDNMDQKLCANFTYIIEYKGNTITLEADCDENNIQFLWLKTILLPQIVKWGEEKNINNTSIASLSLVSSDKYYIKYNELKLKYGNEMVKIWPESTDPLKFVYEDIAIATYLLLLWEDERLETYSKKLQSFVDLGCGNGLLVYILTMEGHPGVGIDVRKRNIWNIYPDIVKLEEKTVTPSDLYLFPEHDWILGNHSDELTPWIPVVAARSSYKTNFFVLPCCAYNFDGTKYQRQNSSKSQYMEYLEYIQDLSQQCGFLTQVDRLKIPSTKRICIIGKNRLFAEEEYITYCNKIQNIISGHPVQDQSSSDTWIQDFKPRESIEMVRNCTKIDKAIVNDIVDTVTRYLLDGLNTEDDWSIGKIVELNEIVNIISSDKLKALKSECGGLQTLLRNNHHIFKVVGGKVQLRTPRSCEEVLSEPKTKRKKSNQIKVKEKPCWFYNNHPQGCLLSDKMCSFLHVKK